MRRQHPQRFVLRHRGEVKSGAPGLYVYRIGSSNSAQPIANASQRGPGVATLPKTKIPFALKKPIKSSLLSLRGMVGTKPDFLIIGAQRSGTTSLYRYLIEHPDILAASRKELNFFCYWIAQGSRWYYAQFPVITQEFIRRILYRRNTITGEASPSYLLYPHTACRVRRMLPDVKLIALLRNPVERAFSNYKFNLTQQYEDCNISFEQALQLEGERIGGAREKMIRDADYINYEYGRFSYVLRGIYVDQLANWLSCFPREQLLIVNSEDLFSDSQATLNRVLLFLGLPEIKHMAYPRHNRTGEIEMAPDTRKYLTEFFRPHNERLYDLLGEDFGWNA